MGKKQNNSELEIAELLNEINSSGANNNTDEQQEEHETAVFSTETELDSNLIQDEETEVSVEETVEDIITDNQAAEKITDDSENASVSDEQTDIAREENTENQAENTIAESDKDELTSVTELSANISLESLQDELKNKTEKLKNRNKIIREKSKKLKAQTVLIEQLQAQICNYEQTVTALNEKVRKLQNSNTSKSIQNPNKTIKELENKLSTKSKEMEDLIQQLISMELELEITKGKLKKFEQASKVLAILTDKWTKLEERKELLKECKHLFGNHFFGNKK